MLDTVLSFHEAVRHEAVPEGEDKAKWRMRELEIMRSNTLKVLRQLSKCGQQEYKTKIIEMISVRQPLIDKHPIEGSSNLFYYLFEDYAAAVEVLNASKLRLDHLVGLLAIRPNIHTNYCGQSHRILHDSVSIKSPPSTDLPSHKSVALEA